MAEATEITQICFDNSDWAYRGSPVYRAQVKAIELYCKTKFECNPNHYVGLTTTAVTKFSSITQLSPTNVLPRILQRITKNVKCDGQSDLSRAVGCTGGDLIHRPPSVKKNLLLFVGGPIKLFRIDAISYGKKLRENGVAVTVVNFYVPEGGYSGLHDYSLLLSEYCYRKRELELLCDTDNHNEISRIIDVEDPSSVCDILSNSVILKEDLLYLQKKRHDQDVIDQIRQRDEQRLEQLSLMERVDVIEPEIQKSKPQLEPCHDDKNKCAEITHICIDNSARAYRGSPTHRAQVKAIELYCKTKLECNPNHFVGLTAMAVSPMGPPPVYTLLSPTNVLQRILHSLEGPIRLTLPDAVMYGKKWRENGIAVNLVNFFVPEGGYSGLRGTSVLDCSFTYAMPSLEKLCDTIVDVEDPSSVCDILSNSVILKEDLLYLQEVIDGIRKPLEQQRMDIIVKAPEIENDGWIHVTRRRIKSAANDENVRAPGIKQTPIRPIPRKEFMTR